MDEALPPPLPERAVLRRLGAFPPGGRVSARTFRPATAAMAAGLLFLRVSRRLLAAAGAGRLVPGSAPRREKKRWLRAYLEQQRLQAAPRRRWEHEGRAAGGGRSRLRSRLVLTAFPSSPAARSSPAGITTRRSRRSATACRKTSR